jgi:chromosome segregation protein
MAQCDERRQALATQREAGLSSLEQARGAASAAQGEVTAAEEALAEAVREREAAERQEADAHGRLAAFREDLARQMEERTDLERQRATLEARLEVLRRSPEGDGRASKGLIQAARRGQLTGLVGRLGRHLRFAPEHRAAILAALGEFKDGLAFRTPEDVDAALGLLDEGKSKARAGLLPLSALRGTPRLEAPDDLGCVGNAADLVEAPAEYRPVVELLLGATLIVTDRRAARRVVAALPPEGRVVTLAGDVFYTAGHVMAGGGDLGVPTEEALRHLEAELRQVRRALAGAETGEARLLSQVEAMEARLNQARAAVQSALEAERQARLRLDQAGLRLEAVRQQEALLDGQVRALEEELAGLEGERAALAESGPAMEAEGARLEAELTAALKEVERSQPALHVTQAEARLEFARREAQEAEARLGELSERLESIERDLEERRGRLKLNQTEQASLRERVTEAEVGMQAIDAQLTSLAAETEPSGKALAEAEATRSQLEARESQARMALQAAERNHTKVQIELARRQEELAGLRRRIEDDFGLVAFGYEGRVTGQDPLPLDGLVERLPKVDHLPLELGQQVERLRAQLRRMGAVNPEAQREHEEVDGRVTFLTSQMDDLRRAESQIGEVIAELDLLMEREFRKTFEAVATAFREAFARLFGGGSARLVLTDPDDLTRSGIDIEARLPGRREQGLAMLSGGERSLTATALVFALLKVSPTPFCVLDEVDAMLDESNVVRFCEMLRELSHETQFVVITHNRLTVEAAEVVYGVSMGPDSASRVISLRLDEAAKEAVA